MIAMMSETYECRSLWRTFMDDARWPVEPGELAALIDMGLSDAQIADYFGIELDDVETLRERYGLS